MKPSHALALALIPGLVSVATALAVWSRHVRDACFFLTVSLAVLAERLDVSFFSQAWYRGTTRGIQVTLLEILALALLVGCWLGRREEPRRWFWPASLGIMLVYFLSATWASVHFLHFARSIRELGGSPPPASHRRTGGRD